MHIIHHMEWESNSSKCMTDEKVIYKEYRIYKEYTWKVRDGALAWAYGTNVYNYQRVRVLDWSWKDWKDSRNMLQVFENTSASISCSVNSSVSTCRHKFWKLWEAHPVGQLIGKDMTQSRFLLQTTFQKGCKQWANKFKQLIMAKPHISRRFHKLFLMAKNRCCRGYGKEQLSFQGTVGVWNLQKSSTHDRIKLLRWHRTCKKFGLTEMQCSANKTQVPNK